MINTDNVVYLAGPITGLSYAGCTEWRDGAIQELARDGIKGVSPLRGKEYLASLETISGHGREYLNMSPLSQPKGVVTRDHWDVIRCKVLFANLLGAKIVSIGTVAEIAWKWHVHGPTVLVMEKQGNPHDHMFITHMATFHVDTIDEGLHLVKAIMKGAI